MQRVFGAFYTKKSAAVGSYKFLVDGERLQDSDTAESEYSSERARARSQCPLATQASPHHLRTAHSRLRAGRDLDEGAVIDAQLEQVGGGRGAARAL